MDALLRRGMRERAAAIERAFQEVLNLCSECREEVFEVQAPANGMKNAGDEGDEETLRPHGGESVFLESVASTMGYGPAREPPVVKEMKKSALLS